MTLTLQKDDLSPALATLQKQAKNPRGLMAAAGRAITNLFKTHLRMLQRSRPNKLGGKRTNFWFQLAQSVNMPKLTETSVTVSISDPRAAHKHTGGTIRAKNARMLTIPVAPEAHGRRASVLEAELGIKLFLLSRDSGAPLLVGQVGGGEQGLKVFYALKASVFQMPDPPEGILPPEADIKREALAAAQAALLRQLKPPSAPSAIT
jgi:hypothetical protein